MNIFKRIYLRWRTQKDKDFLISEGLRKAKKSGLEVHMGKDYLFHTNDKKGEIHLPSYEEGIDTKELIALVADDYPKITRRYLDNKRILT